MTILVAKPAPRIARTPSTPPAIGMLTSMIDDVGRQRADPIQRLEPVVGLADDGHVELGVDEPGERLAEERLVVNQEDAQGRWRVRHAAPLAQADLDPGPLAGRGVHGEGTADLLDPLSHRGQAEAVVERLLEASGVEARSHRPSTSRATSAVVGVEAHGRVSRPGVLADIGERLLDHPQQLDLTPRA